ncbi:hypothetical protein KA107_03145 [Candidatus Pacearchaeota archaeon]|nr:hypothetical protein [Candidatus Pacearchaeota archaeon]
MPKIKSLEDFVNRVRDGIRGVGVSIEISVRALNRAGCTSDEFPFLRNYRFSGLEYTQELRYESEDEVKQTALPNAVQSFAEALGQEGHNEYLFELPSKIVPGQSSVSGSVRRFIQGSDTFDASTNVRYKH